MSTIEHTNLGRRVDTIAAIAETLKLIPYQACSGAREAAHQKGECNSALNGRQPIFALLGYDDVQTLQGRLLTIVDASFSDAVQRKAFKDLVRKEIWFNWVKYLDTDEPSGGMPDRS